MDDRWLYPWALGSVAFGGASLLVPLNAVQLGASAVQLGLLASAAAIAGAAGAIVFGRLADRVGSRRPLVLGTLGVFATCLAVIPFLGSVTAIIVARGPVAVAIAPGKRQEREHDRDGVGIGNVPQRPFGEPLPPCAGPNR